MKTKIAMSLFLAAAVWCYAVPVTVVNPSFELPASGKQTNWDNVPGWSSDTTAADSGVEEDADASDGAWRGFLNAADPAVWQITNEVIDAGQTYVLEVDIKDTWDSSTSLISLFYVDNGGGRVPVASTQATDFTADAWSRFSVEYVVDDGPAAAIGKPLGIQFENDETDNYGWIGLDHVTLEKLISYVSPIHPANGAVYVGVDDDLSWTVANGWNVDLYWGPESDPNLSSTSAYKRISNGSATTWDPGTMATGKVYYWRVDALEPNALDYIVHPGPVWSYETVGGSPRDITISPAAGQSVAEHGDAVFVAGGVNIDTWDWYKVGDANPLANGADYLVDANELTILDAGLDDEGFYYCIGSSTQAPAAPAIETEPAQLMLRRLMGHWKLDDNLADSVTDVYPLADAYPGIMEDPNYTAGIDGGTIEFVTQTAPYRYVTIPDTNDVYDFYPLGLTVSAWVKTTETGWGAIAAKADRGATLVGWSLQHNGDSIYLTCRGGGEASVDVGLADDEWHLVAGTYDPVTGIKTVYGSYVDEYGIIRFNQAQTAVNRNFTFTDMPLTIGMETNQDDSDVNPFIGLIDDVRIYTYAMDISEIAQTLFLPIHGGSVCANPDYNEAFDLDHDCRTNLSDLALFAEAWLTDGFYQAP